jgi:hypothetical protein
MADGATTPAVTIVKDPDGFCAATWTTSTLGGAATGGAASFPASYEAFFQVTGTFGSATAVLEGSLDNTNWFSLYTTQQVATAGKHDLVSLTAAGAFPILSLPRYFRFKTTGGTSTSLVCTVTAKRLAK